MKTFQQFNEDLRKLQRGLEALERESAPKQRLAARRGAARQRSRDITTNFAAQQKSEAKQRQRALERVRKAAKQQREQLELQLEQDPHMTPTPFNIMKAREQARGGIAHRRHVHGELAREAGAQQTAKRQRLNKLMSK